MWCNHGCKPIHRKSGLPRNHFNLGIRFMQEGRRFQRALSCADDRDSLARKLSDLPTFVAVNCLLRREVLEYCGLFLKRANPCGDHHIRRANLFTVLQREPEARLIPVDTQNRSLSRSEPNWCRNHLPYSTKVSRGTGAQGSFFDAAS